MAVVSSPAAVSPSSDHTMVPPNPVDFTYAVFCAIVVGC
jgi:hypothetical protein